MLTVQTDKSSLQTTGPGPNWAQVHYQAAVEVQGQVIRNHIRVFISSRALYKTCTHIFTE